MQCPEGHCLCCGTAGLSDCTIRRHIQRLKPCISNDEDIDILSSGDDTLDLSNSSSSESIMDITSDEPHSDPSLPSMSPPTSPSPEHNMFSVGDYADDHIDHTSNHTINSLTMCFSTLSLVLKSHLEAELPDDSDDDTNVTSYNEEDGGMENGSDDLVDVYDDMGSDKELREAFQLSPLCSNLSSSMALASSPDYTLLDIESLSEEDIDSLKMFSLIRRGNISRSIHVMLATFWNNRIHIESMYKLCRRIASLSQIKTIVYDCCINSCCAFIGTNFKSAQSCPFCHEP